MYQLSPAAARAVMLAAQHLLQPPDRVATRADVLQAIHRMGALQIDTIHVVARSPYLVLWSRLGDFDPVWLDALLADGALFEFWSHEACFLPIEDFPLYRRLMLERRKGWSTSGEWLERHPAEVAALLEHVRTHGPVRSADFRRTDGKKGGWWEWKIEKIMLEHLHNTGVFMIAKRQNFHRVYDLRERVLPGWDDREAPAYEDVARTLALKAARALGLTTDRWLADYFRMPKRESGSLLARLEAEGALERVAVEGWKEPLWAARDQLPLVEAAAAGRLEPTVTTLLSPFDPVVWDRARAKALFNFDYRIECYTPAPKRRYGYFSLPILHRGALVGRLDPKAHRAEGRLEVKALHLDPGVEVTERLLIELARTLHAFARWHRTPAVEVREADRPGLADALREALQATMG